MHDGVFITNLCIQLCIYCTSFSCYIEFYMDIDMDIDMDLDINLDGFGAAPTGRHNLFKCSMCATTYSVFFTTCSSAIGNTVCVAKGRGHIRCTYFSLSSLAHPGLNGSSVIQRIIKLKKYLDCICVPTIHFRCSSFSRHYWPWGAPSPNSTCSNQLSPTHSNLAMAASPTPTRSNWARAASTPLTGDEDIGREEGGQAGGGEKKGKEGEEVLEPM